MNKLFHVLPAQRAALLALGFSALILGGCGKTESPATTAKTGTAMNSAEEQHAAAEKPGEHRGTDEHVASEKAGAHAGEASKDGDGHGDEHEAGGVEALKLSAEEIQSAGIESAEIRVQEVSEPLTRCV